MLLQLLLFVRAAPSVHHVMSLHGKKPLTFVPPAEQSVLLQCQDNEKAVKQKKKNALEFFCSILLTGIAHLFIKWRCFFLKSKYSYQIQMQ